MKKVVINIMLLVAFIFLLNSCGEGDVTEPNYDTIIDNYPWQYGTLQELGLRENLINEGFNDAQASGYINSIVIIRNGKIAAERYYRNTNANTVFDIKSATKSFTSALVGNAIKRNYFTLDTKFMDVFPEYSLIPTDIRVKNITVRHLLTMSSGIKSDEALNLINHMNDDWVIHIITQRLDFDPGTTWRYSDAGVHLLSAIIQKSTNQNTKAFANSTLFNYLNITLQSWLPDPQGIPFGGANMKMTVKSMATLGVLYMNNGYYNYRPVVPEEWVSASVTDQTGIGYGYLWWIKTINGHRIFAAMGYAGQLVVCIPDLNMIVATSAPSDVADAQAIAQMDRLWAIITNYFIPAAIISEGGN
ncbi:MAG: hypothetical protein C0412_08485 [Flavobacterium sp.]|nr:hypothetical protein [Flavobacterium sp.]